MNFWLFFCESSQRFCYGWEVGNKLRTVVYYVKKHFTCDVFVEVWMLLIVSIFFWCSVFTSSTFISSVPFGTAATAFILVATIMLVLTLVMCVSVIKSLIFRWVSDDFFEMVSLVVNGDGNGEHLILLDSMFDSVDFCSIADEWCWACSIDCSISGTFANVRCDPVVLAFLNCKWLWLVLESALLWNPPIHSIKLTFLNLWRTARYFHFFVERQSLKRNDKYITTVFFLWITINSHMALFLWVTTNSSMVFLFWLRISSDMVFCCEWQ